MKLRAGRVRGQTLVAFAALAFSNIASYLHCQHHPETSDQTAQVDNSVEKHWKFLAG